VLYPSIDKLLDKVDSKYSLVVAVAKRARMLREGAHQEIVSPKSHKMVGVALEELYGGQIHYEKVQSKEALK